MKKQTKVLLAAALFTLGASFSSMAALKNDTWKPSEEGWQYVDKDGDFVEEEWCVSYGFYFDAKGRMVQDTKKTIGDYTYYFDAEGKMLTGWVEYAKDAKDVYHASAADENTTVGNVFFTNGDGHSLSPSG